MKKLQYKGELYNMRELSELSGVPYAALANRLASGYTVEEAVSDNPRIPQSVREFSDHDDYKTWNGMVNSDLYEKYHSWCIKNEFRPESSVHFTRCIKSLHPNIRVVPTRLKKNGEISYKRIIRVDYYGKCIY